MADNRTGNTVGSPNRRGRVFGRRIDPEKERREQAKQAQGPQHRPKWRLPALSGLLVGGVGAGLILAVVAVAVVWSLGNGGGKTGVERTAANEQTGSVRKAAFNLPKCGSRDVKRAVNRRLRERMQDKNLDARKFKMKVGSFKDLGVTEDGRRCSVAVRTPAGRHTIELGVTWENRAKKVIAVQFLTDDSALWRKSN